MATSFLRLLEESVREAILVSCRNALRASGFRFEDSWAKVIPGSDEGVYAWVAANYAMGTLGGDPHKTIGIIELGGASAQLTFVSDEVLPLELSTNFTFGETTYTLYSNSFLNFGQNAAQDSYREMLKSRERCEYQRCHLGSNFVPELLGHFLATENFYFTSKFFGLDRSSSLSDFVVAGEQLCNKDLSTLRQTYLNHSDEDFSRYCFSSAYIVALLHDNLGVPLDDKRQAYHIRTLSFFLSEIYP
uniref:Nucleoside-triphosphatase ntp-1 n=1 Tax=Aegilops tauschii TaxID=37682 RepID=M8CH01_AEGTA